MKMQIPARFVRTAVALTATAAAALGALAPASPAHAATCTSNAVVCENALPGTPQTDWAITGAGDPSIQGYATQVSVQAGDTVHFKINTPATAYHLDILRLGYYGGTGARKVAAGIQPSASLPQTQPTCLTDNATGLTDCGNWSDSAQWTVPANAVSGVYLAHLVRDDTPGQGSLIHFVVRNDASTAAMVVQTSDTEKNAYNRYGGNSLYYCGWCTGRAAAKVSFNRPDTAADLGTVYSILDSEWPMIEFLEQNGYDVTYQSDVDTDRNTAANLEQHKVFVSSGHDEYWSAAQRSNVEAARDAGVNLAFFSGNEIFWKIRYEPAIDGSNAAYRTEVSYKETYGTLDPADPPTSTATWRDTRFGAPADGGRPENSLSGQLYMVDGADGTNTAIQVPAADGQMRFWRNTSVAALAPGTVATLAPNTLGYEWDVDIDNGSRPAGLFHLSSTTESVAAYADQNFGTKERPAVATHTMTLYRAPSGALVFGSGTVQWSWGLGGAPNGAAPPDPRMQQATVNLFADMGVQPATLASGLVPATASTDTTPPVSTIASPVAGDTVANGSTVTVTGTATDVGGRVGGVEVSTDNGVTWHPATGRGNWSYSWQVLSSGPVTIRSRAVDDSGNLETPSAGTTVNAECPCQLFAPNATPATGSNPDGSVEVGTRFSVDSSGYITSLRFYKDPANTGPHTGSLWTAGGTLLAQATFTNETPSGWQQQALPTPVAVFAGQTYVASYHTTNYASTEWGFANTRVDSGPLHAPADAPNAPNGVYRYGASPVFPNNSYHSTNYFVDATFVPATPPAPTCPCNIFSTNSAPAVGSNPDASVEVGTRFTVDSNGYITALRFYKDPSNTGSHVGSLWTSDGTLLAQAAFTNETASGWQSVTLTSPVPIYAGQSYVTSYHTTNYSTTEYAFAGSGIDNGPMHATADSPSTPNGVYRYGAGPVFPNNSFHSTNYWVDATFVPGTPPTPTCPCNLFSAGLAPAGGLTNDAPVEVGTRFVSDRSGYITALRFYKDPANTGPHTGSLWAADGTLLAQADYTNETASGWQSVTLPTPVPVVAGQAYVTSYHTTTYNTTEFAFAGAAVDNGPLHAPADTAGAPNGVYSYGATPVFPVTSYRSSNYWVDVTFADSLVPVPDVPSNVTAVAGDRQATVSWTAPASSDPITAYTITPYIGSDAQIPTQITGNPPLTTATITGLTDGATYTFVVTATNAGGTGAASAGSNAVTPLGVPGAPPFVFATRGDQQATVSWIAPDAGGTPITSYTITPYIGSVAQPATTVSNSPAVNSANVTGLTNGTAYTFTVAATNVVGTGAASAASNHVTPAGDPSVPTNVVATGGNQQATVSWTAPASGGSTITSYTITPYIGAVAQPATTITGTPPATTATVLGLTNGTTYTFTVTATNGIGAGTESLPSNAVTPAAPPDAPSGVTATSGDQQAAVSWTAPNNNGSPITSYTITPYIGITAQTPTTITGNPPVTNATITGLTNGTSYTFQVTATSAIGTSLPGVSNAVTPAGLPGAPTNVTATRGSQQASVSWTAPNSNGSPIASYTITPFIGTTAQTATTITGNPPATSATITGLTNGTTYTFKVTATNGVGTGAASAASNSVTPAAVPNAPTNVTATRGNASATVSWTAPSGNGSTITSYTITPFVGTTAQTAKSVTGNPPATNTTFTGLTNGTTYTFKVTATNAIGTGPASTASNAVTPATVPNAPTNVTATRGDKQVALTWTAPANNGATITSYTITPFIGTTAQTATTITGNPPTANATITGLVNGTTYTFKVTATNAVGTGPASASSNSVTPAGVPVAPTAVVATPTPTSTTTGSLVVTFTAGSSNGSAITGFTATCTSSNGGTTRSQAGTASPITVANLTTARLYTCTVTATNAVGTSAASTASAAIAVGAPSSPTNVTATRLFSGWLRVAFTAPANNGSSITGYTATCTSSNGGATRTGTGTSSPINVTSLTGGRSYTCTVTATNSRGTSLASAPSAAVNA